MRSFLVLWLLLVATSHASDAQSSRFRVLAIYENGGHHVAYSKAARAWLDKLAADSNFSVDYVHNTDSIAKKMLERYQLFIQLDYPPYGWKPAAQEAFIDYMEKGTGGWIGFHHASLLGDFDGFSVWEWFANWMGKIRFRNYIADFADGRVKVEQPGHPVLKNVPATFDIQKEEWYTYDRSPRTDVQVLASVDESTYVPMREIKMGDHPVIWTQPRLKARNVYIFMGHGPWLFENEAYTTLFRNAIFWAAGK